MDNRRVMKGNSLYLPVQVAGAYLSMGDAHLAQVRASTRSFPRVPAQADTGGHAGWSRTRCAIQACMMLPPTLHSSAGHVCTQGDSELDGTGIETSINGRFKLTLHKAKDLPAIVQVWERGEGANGAAGTTIAAERQSEQARH